MKTVVIPIFRNVLLKANFKYMINTNTLGTLFNNELYFYIFIKNVKQVILKNSFIIPPAHPTTVCIIL